MKIAQIKLALLSALLGTSLSASAEMVNINDASATAMAHYLKGIGEVKAESIVDYRELNGDFKNLDDLVNVKGIGKGILEKNRKDMSLTEGVVKWIKSKPKLVAIDKKSDGKKVKAKAGDKKKVVATVDKKLPKQVKSTDSKRTKSVLVETVK